MRHLLPGLFTGIGLTALASGALAQDSVLWKTIGKWTVSIDTTIQNGCYAVTGWDNGTVLRIGLNPAEDNFYLLVGNKDWTEFAPNTEYDIRIKFDSKAAWDVTATGLKFFADDATYLHAEGSTFAFLEEFMRHREMKIRHETKELDRLTLRGSSRAFREVMTCQTEVDTKGLPPTQPRAEAVRKTPAVGQGEDVASN